MTHFFGSSLMIQPTPWKSKKPPVICLDITFGGFLPLLWIRWIHCSIYEVDTMFLEVSDEPGRVAIYIYICVIDLHRLFLAH